MFLCHLPKTCSFVNYIITFHYNCFALALLIISIAWHCLALALNSNSISIAQHCLAFLKFLSITELYVLVWLVLAGSVVLNSMFSIVTLDNVYQYVHHSAYLASPWHHALNPIIKAEKILPQIFLDITYYFHFGQHILVSKK